MKPQTLALYEYLRKVGGWVSVRQLLEAFPSNTPTKRVSELDRLGLIEKRRGEKNPKFVLYRAKETAL